MSRSLDGYSYNHTLPAGEVRQYLIRKGPQ